MNAKRIPQSGALVGPCEDVVEHDDAISASARNEE